MSLSYLGVMFRRVRASLLVHYMMASAVQRFQVCWVIVFNITVDVMHIQRFRITSSFNDQLTTSMTLPWTETVAYVERLHGPVMVTRH
jgi:hypothetical protein